MKLSVLVAVYNGEKYIEAQLRSIIPQIGPEDEVLISDDAPWSATYEAIKPFLKDERVKYLEGPGRGIDKNKEFLLRSCGGDVAFLCDQDDVWLPHKVEKCLEEINGGACCVLHYAFITDAELHKTGDTLFRSRKAAPGLIHNVIWNCYTGCCMALTRQAFQSALPFPESIPMHDQWLGLVAEKVGKVAFIDEPLLLWRRNPGSATGKGSGAVQKLKWRVGILKSVLSFSAERNDRD